MQETDNTKTNSSSAQQELIVPWTPRRLWTVRLILLILISGWALLWLHVHHNVKVSRAKVETARLEAQRRDERLRRGAQYRQDLQERTQAPQTRNAFDGR